uniref:myeloid cell surface antigen CD33-like n=1 Tax=Callospermophilus lateralis TaxID=76772 RepID=UPI0040385C9B
MTLDYEEPAEWSRPEPPLGEGTRELSTASCPVTLGLSGHLTSLGGHFTVRGRLKWKCQCLWVSGCGVSLLSTEQMDCSGSCCSAQSQEPRTLCLPMLRLLLLLSLLWAVEGTCAVGLRSLNCDDPRLPQGPSPQDPEHSVDVPKSVTVQEGLCVLVPCGFSYRGSETGNVSVYWFHAGDNTDHGCPVATNNSTRRVQEETQGRFHLLGDPGTNNCSLSIRDAKRNDTGCYLFRVEKGKFKWNYYTKKVVVHVTDLTHTPDILIPGTLESGRHSNLTCSVPWACEQGTPPTFSWVGPSVSSLGPNIVHSSVLTLTPRPQDHGTNLTCQVKFPAAGVTTERTIQLNVTWRDEVRQVLWGAIGGAGVTALVALGLCLTFSIMKTHRRKAARAAEDMSDTQPALQPASLGCRQEPPLPGPADPCSSSGDGPDLGQEQELLYATLSFHRASHNVHGASPAEDTSTQYSEIRAQGGTSRSLDSAEDACCGATLSDHALQS